MLKEELLYIEDANKRRLFYRFTPAAFISNFVPLVVILHDEGQTEAAPFEYKMWNVLTPVDNFGYQHKGSCWLGEEGDFFLKELLQELIMRIAQEYECEEHIYLYGSGMGGYGAILHGILCGANAVYANAPYIRLDAIQKTQFYEAIFGQTESRENDLGGFLHPHETFPIFYLCDQTDKVKNPHGLKLKEDTAYFEKLCKKYALSVDTEFCQKRAGGDEMESSKAVLDFFERIVSQR